MHIKLKKKKETMALALGASRGSRAQVTEHTPQSANKKMDRALKRRQPNSHKSWTVTKSRKKNNRQPEERVSGERQRGKGVNRSLRQNGGRR